MGVVRVGVVENGFFKVLHFDIHLVFFDTGFELGEVVDSAFAVGGSNDMLRILTNIFGDFSPGCLDSGDRVRQRSVLLHEDCQHE